MKKRVISLLMALALTVGLLPTSALAAGTTNWAQSAVDALNAIYGSSIFSADDTAEMSEKDTVDLLEKMGCTTDVVLDNGTSGAQLTRGKACEVLADVFDLPVDTAANQTAIDYLYSRSIINGTVNGLEADGAVSKAAFAALTYRVLNAVGGGMGSDTDLVPGSDAYFAWMYLAARKCVPVDVYPNAAQTAIQDVTMNIEFQDEYGDWVGEEKTGQDLWNAWIGKLANLHYAGAFQADYPGGSTNLLAAVVTIVDEYIAQGGSKTIFSDVSAESSFYDGVMYLFDRGIVTGEGDGTFSAARETTRNEFAVLLYRNAGRPDAAGNTDIEKAQAYVTAPEQGYMTPVAGDDTWWSAAITRQEAIVAVMKACADDTAIAQANTAVLERFSDADSVSQAAKPYVAYAVSIGLVSGTTDAAINPSGTVNRGTAGVLLYRTLLGVDKTKMKDYADNAAYVLSDEAAATLSLPVNRIDAVAVSIVSKTLTLREDWRLTENLDLKVPEGTALVINGDGHHIYEMGGMLQNSGKGTVMFADGTILYPAGGTPEGITVNGIWDTEESNALLVERKPKEHRITVAPVTGGTVTADKTMAQFGETVTLTITPDDGYEMEKVVINDGMITLHDNQFMMPDGDVTISATFAEIPAIDDDNASDDNNGATDGSDVPDDDNGGATDDSDVPDNDNGGATDDSDAPDNDNGGATDDNDASDENNSDATGGSGATGGGGSIGGGGVSAPTNGTTTNADGSTTTTVTNPTTGTVTETTQYPDGSSKVVATQKDGTVTTTTTDTDGNKTEVVENTDGSGRTVITNANGATSTTTVSESGRVECAVQLPESMVSAAANRGEVVALPMPAVPVTTNQADAPIVTVALSGDSAKVEIPVRNVTAGTVAVRVKADGTEEIVKTSVPTDNGVVVTLSDGDTVRIVDNSKAFADVPETYWGADAVAFATSRELFAGTSSMTFAPETPMTRAMILTVLARFEDVDTSVGENWYAAGQQWAMENGVSDGSNPMGSLTREQLVTMLHRYAGEPAVGETLDGYVDSDSVSAYAQQAMDWAVNEGIITGYTTTTLHPKEEATRAQVATILMRFVENIAAS
nr:S-layer homology domain-containing protein [uncultured Agathobaculum sp.]